MIRQIRILFVLIVCFSLTASAQTWSDSVSLENKKYTFGNIYRDSTLKTTQKIKKYGNIFTRLVRAFDEFDTTYITPNYYNWAFLMQNTNTFEYYNLNSRQQEQRIGFSPHPSIKVGPYLGWRWIFLGYTFDVASLGKSESRRTEFELSLYSSMVGCDLIYRRTGDNFRIHSVSGFGDEAERVEGHDCKGILIDVTGVNLYYVFNHKHFSYPAAFAQSTIQRKSCGTWKAGFSITQHKMKFDYKTLPPELIRNPEYPLSKDFMFERVNYTDFSISCGYAYNWVFRKNSLFCISLAPAIGYKKTNGKSAIENDITPYDDKPLSKAFSINNFNLNFTGRMGLVWNNSKYYSGLSLIVHNYNYRHSKLSIHNTFGTLNFYIGFNFKKKKQYKNL